MKKVLAILAATVFALTTSMAFAKPKADKELQGNKAEHEMTVGNEKAADSGSTADDKTVKEEKTHKHEGKAKGKGHEKKK